MQVQAAVPLQVPPVTMKEQQQSEAVVHVGLEMPLQVLGRIHAETRQDSAPDSVPTEFSGELIFRDGASASFYCSFITENSEWAVVSGTNFATRRSSDMNRCVRPKLRPRLPLVNTPPVISGTQPVVPGTQSVPSASTEGRSV